MNLLQLNESFEFDYSWYFSPVFSQVVNFRAFFSENVRRRPETTREFLSDISTKDRTCTKTLFVFLLKQLCNNKKNSMIYKTFKRRTCSQFIPSKEDVTEYVLTSFVFFTTLWPFPIFFIGDIRLTMLTDAD